MLLLADHETSKGLRAQGHGLRRSYRNEILLIWTGQGHPGMLTLATSPNPMVSNGLMTETPCRRRRD